MDGRKEDEKKKGEETKLKKARKEIDGKKMNEGRQ